MEKSLVVTNQEVGIMISPEETLEFASRAAKALKQVISLKPKPVIMNGEQYLEMEDWELCGQFYGYTVRTGEAMPVEVDGVKGAKAHADLIDIKTGMYLGGAEAYCMRDEEHWNTRPKYEWQGEGDNRKRIKVGDEIVPWFQLALMAQTRAGAKAFRNRLAWVVVLAGYRATPAEEMTDDTASPAVKERRTVDKSEHWCPVHNAKFFKSGKMRGYAHKIEGTNDWCNEPDIKQAEKDSKDLRPRGGTNPELSSEALSSVPDETAQGATKGESDISAPWVKEGLTTLKGKWDSPKWIKENFDLEVKTFADIKDKLNPEQQGQFLVALKFQLEAYKEKGV